MDLTWGFWIQHDKISNQVKHCSVETACNLDRIKITNLPLPCIADAEKYPPAFEPADINCLTAPTSYNSYFLKVCDVCVKFDI